ncbi:MAG: FeoA family protein [Campylobacterota bacterium]
MLLSDVKNQVVCKIDRLDATGKLLKKFLDMGFVKGVDVEVIREAPLYDPMQLKVHNYYVSIRKEEARGIEVTLND